MNKISQEPISLSASQLKADEFSTSIFSTVSNKKSASKIITKKLKKFKNSHLRIRSKSKTFFDDDHQDVRLLGAKLKYNANEISIIGVRQCSDPGRSTVNRFMWALFVCSGLSLAIYQIIDRIDYFFSYPTSIHLDIVPSENMSFPQVTICSNNYIKAKAARELGLTEYFKQFLPPYVSETVNKSSLKLLIPKVNQTELVRRRKFLSSGREDIEECTWNGHTCPDDLITTNFTNVGRCLVFNSNHKYYVDRLGQKVGLLLYLKGHQKDYFIQSISSIGYTILVHEQHEPARVMELGFRVSLGQRYGIAISATNTIRLKAPYGTCTDKRGYHPVKCQRSCITEKIVKSCGCRPIYLDALGNETICDYFDENECAENIYSSYNIKSPKYQTSCICPPLCEEFKYRSFVTGAKISEHYVKVQSSDSYKDVLEDYVILRIYFKSMEYTEIQTVQAHSFMALLSDIGGALGLLLGSTILTVVEVLEIIVDSLTYVSAKRNTQKKSSRYRF